MWGFLQGNPRNHASLKSKMVEFRVAATGPHFRQSIWMCFHMFPFCFRHLVTTFPQVPAVSTQGWRCAYQRFETPGLEMGAVAFPWRGGLRFTSDKFILSSRTMRPDQVKNVQLPPDKIRFERWISAIPSRAQWYLQVLKRFVITKYVMMIFFSSQHKSPSMSHSSELHDHMVVSIGLQTLVDQVHDQLKPWPNPTGACAATREPIHVLRFPRFAPVEPHVCCRSWKSQVGVSHASDHTQHSKGIAAVCPESCLIRFRQRFHGTSLWAPTVRSSHTCAISDLADRHAWCSS